jgi:hypothetical protein
MIECLDPAVTRVQILSRPLISTNFIDFGSNKRFVTDMAATLRARYGYVGPLVGSVAQ